MRFMVLIVAAGMPLLNTRRWARGSEVSEVSEILGFRQFLFKTDNRKAVCGELIHEFLIVRCVIDIAPRGDQRVRILGGVGGGF